MSAVKAVPDDYPRVIPYLLIDGATDAIDFYKDVLGERNASGWAARTARWDTPNCRSATRS